MYTTEGTLIRKRAMYIIIAAAVLTILGLIVSIVLSFNDTDYTITVIEKERIVESDGDGESKSNTITSKYLVWGKTPDGDVLVFQNTDNFFRWKFDSSTVQGKLEVGKTFKITVVGLRIPFLSCYQNIIKFEEEKIQEDNLPTPETP